MWTAVALKTTVVYSAKYRSIKTSSRLTGKKINYSFEECGGFKLPPYSFLHYGSTYLFAQNKKMRPLAHLTLLFL
jgi:hypothetical protein